MKAIILAALAIPVVAALAVLVAIARLARRLDSPHPVSHDADASVMTERVRPGRRKSGGESDDSEVVGMPTTWNTDCWDSRGLTTMTGYFTTVPTSRN